MVLSPKLYVYDKVYTVKPLLGISGEPKSITIILSELYQHIFSPILFKSKLYSQQNFSCFVFSDMTSRICLPQAASRHHEKSSDGPIYFRLLKKLLFCFKIYTHCQKYLISVEKWNFININLYHYTYIFYSLINTSQIIT